MVGEGELYGLGFRRLNVPPEGRSRGDRVPSSIWSRSAYEPIFRDRCSIWCSVEELLQERHNNSAGISNLSECIYDT